MKFFAVLLLVLSLSACVSREPETPKRVLTPVALADLPGWQTDHVGEATPALKNSCRHLATQPDWAKPCLALATLPAGDEVVRAYLAAWFQPYAISDNGKDDGLFTGYYEAELQGSLRRHDQFQTPIYARPDDLITVDLGDFKPALKGQHLAGKIVGQKLKPYDDRAMIGRGALEHRAPVLAWVDDSVSAFFLAVQGSGRIRLDDGATLRVGYDGTNGRDYIAIGRVLADRGDLQKPVTMRGIRGWLAAHPERMNEVMNLNPSFVFFRVLQGDGPVGAEGVALTAGRSMAVDPAFVPLGTPLWLDATDGNGATLQRLMVAQDTGGAIKGVVRGDIFWGFGPEAETQAGAMQSRGRYFMLLPKTVIPHDAP